jgi:ribosome biogenesis GTPase
MSDVETARVVRQDAHQCIVRLGDGEEIPCSVRGKVHLLGSTRTGTTALAVGDRVSVERLRNGEGGRIVSVLPRKGVLSRPDPHHRRRQNILATNVDQVVAMTSAVEPEFSPGIVDRVFTAAEWCCVDAMLVVNKRDLAPKEPPEAEAYRRIGYRVLFVSARTGEGVDDVRAALSGKTSVVTGHSGVGKTSVLNAVEPGLGLKVGTVNPVTRRGTQTTTAAVLVDLEHGGAVIDTPGIREFGLYNVPKRELTWLFRDLRTVGPRCRFKDCLHVGEPGCAMPAAVESGEIAPFRWDSYRRLLETMSDVKSWEIPGRK